MKKFVSRVLSGPRLFPLLAIVLLPSLAQAHPGLPGHTHGLANGLSHPLTGLDHLCAMVAIGLWAAQRGGRALWVVPSVFVSVMILGSAFGTAGVPVPLVEPGIVASVLVLGILTAAAVRLPLAVSGLVVGVFALCHGYAHGAEMPASASGLVYGLGFVSATMSLHLLGISLGLLARRFSSERMVRWAGGAIAVCGVCYLCLAA